MNNTSDRHINQLLLKIIRDKGLDGRKRKLMFELLEILEVSNEL